MRRTGLRLGELQSLPYQCLRIDPQGNRYLKVPLGKLNSERLVPLDDKTYKLVRDLQQRGRKHRDWLLSTRSGEKTTKVPYNRILRAACEGLRIPDRVTTHRLRHTYATELITAGMSLVGVMRLLGHRDFRMTLRYAAITPELVRTEYDHALSQLEKRYFVATEQETDADPAKILADALRALQNRLADTPAQRDAQLLIRRLRRLRADLRILLKSHEP